MKSTRADRLTEPTDKPDINFQPALSELGIYRYGLFRLHSKPYPTVHWARRMLCNVMTIVSGSHDRLIWDWIYNLNEHRALADALRRGKDFSMELRGHELAARFKARPVTVLRLFQPCACQGLCKLND